MARHRSTKKSYIQIITQYGIHIWAILIIANAVMVYAYQFSTHAAGKSDETLHALDVSATPSPSTSPSEQVSPSASPSTGPLGPAINLQFTVPGIGSGGGVMNPLHPQRNVTVYLYAPDVNSMNTSVKPLYTIQTTATFDSDQYSPTYTSFLNPSIDLGSDVKDGNYQIAFRTDQSLRTLIKEDPTDLGGEIFGLNQTVQVPPIPPQTVLMGDTIPTKGGDNTININDYNAFVTCYGSANTTNSFCKTGNYGDFNDDGVIDGIDYNILLRSLYALSQEGLAVPELTPSPSPATRVTKLIHPVTPTLPTKKIGTTSSKGKTSISKKSGSVLGGILFIIFLIIVGVIAFIFRSKIMSLIHLSPTGKPSTENTETTEETSEQAEGAEQTDETAAQEETPEQQETAQPEAKQNETEQSAEQPTDHLSDTPQTEPEEAGDMLEKDCYIKTKGKDEAGTGMWLLLTDDFGAMNAHYSKTDAKDGFAKVKGVLKIENDKKFLEVSELTMEG